MKEEPHHSFKEFYEAKEPTTLPFNQVLETKGAGESFTFLSIPFKHNARTLPKPNKIKELFENEKVQYSYLNFEKALMPHILVTSSHDTTKTLKILLEHEQQLKLDDYYCAENPNPEGLVLSHFPSDSQWYTINQLRIHAGRPERSVNGIETLAKYYAQLEHLERKFAFDTGKVQIGFVWYESWFPEQSTITGCIQYEKASVLYNIASVYSQLGALERLWTSEGKKRSASYFQKAAGMLLYIRDVLVPRFKITLDPNADLHESSLSSMATLMLAQAAECFYEKANDDESTSMLTAVVAVYVSDLYDVTLKPIKHSSTILKQKIPKKVLLHIKTKHQLYAAIAQFHTKAVTSNDRAVSERLARRNIGKRLITLALGYAQEVGGLLYDHVKSYAETFTTAFMALESANHELIHETPFDERLLAPLRRPPEALVNPVEPTYVLDVIQKTPDVLDGLMSSTQHVLLQEILCESRRLAHDGQVKLNSLIEYYGKPFPSLGPLPNDKMTESTFQQMRIDSKKLTDQLQEFQKWEEQLCCKDLISCLEKIDTYTCSNLNESFGILTELLKEHKKEASSTLSLQSILVTVKEKQTEQTENAKKIKEKLQYYTKNVADFDISAWSAEKVKTLVSLSGSDPAFFSGLQSKWIEIANFVEKEKVNIKDVLQACSVLLGDLKQLPNTAWTASRTSPMSELIQARKQLVKDLDKKCESFPPLFEESLKRIKSKESETKAILQTLDELVEESKIVESFKGSVTTFIDFHQSLQHFAKNFLHFRNQSCRLLYLCLELKHSDCEEYVKSSAVSRDPHLLTLIKHSDHHTETISASKETLTLDQLILLLKDSAILPLRDVFGHQSSFQNFWKTIHDRGTPTEIPNAKKKPGVLSRRELLEQLPTSSEEQFFDAVSFDNDNGPRKPKDSFITRKGSGYDAETHAVHFEETAPKSNPVIGGLLSNIWKAKDTFVNLLSAKKKIPQQTRKSSRNPFQGYESRRASASSALEMTSMLSSEDLESSTNSDEYIKRIMKENSRLRAEMVNMRQDLKQDKEHKINELELRLRQLEKSRKVRPERRDSRPKERILEAGKMVLSPAETSSNFGSSQSELSSSKNNKIKRATSIAAAVVAGISAAEHLSRQGKKQKDRKETINQTMVYPFTDQTVYAEGIDLKRSILLKKDDSGIGRSTRASDDEIVYGKRDYNPNIKVRNSFKEDNDRLVKALGLK